MSLQAARLAPVWYSISFDGATYRVRYAPPDSIQELQLELRDLQNRGSTSLSQPQAIGISGEPSVPFPTGSLLNL